MNQLEAALYLTQKGFHVFPIKAQTKNKPIIKDFPNLATRNEDKIHEWFGNGKKYNIGISTTKFLENESLIVVDVDNAKGKNGDKTLLELEFSGFELPLTLEQKTPSGGRHLVYKTKEPHKQGVNVLGSGLDIRSKGGYILGVGSSLPHGSYTLIDREITEAPVWLIEKLKKVRENVETIKRIEGINEDMAVQRAMYYLENEAPPSIEGEGGDQNAYVVAARVKDFGVSQSTCHELMLDFWNHKCQPPWDSYALALKVENAYRYGEEPIGVKSPEAVFTKIEEVKQAEEKSYLEKINEEYALIYMEGNHFILYETIDEKGRRKRVFLNENSFKRKFSPYTIQTGKGKAPTYAEVWLDWEKRREYAGVCFAPERAPKHNYYNLWSGFTCKPTDYETANPLAKKGFDMFIEHAKENVCGGDEKLFKWLMGYFAHLVQKPYERPLTTLVFRGTKGTGKNVLVDRVGKLLGRQHYLVAQNSRYLTSNFNGHMDSALMLVLDEAFWSGDKASEGQLKGLTTSPEILIERKGKEPYTVDNLVRIIVIGNEEWLVPASGDERRYAVFQMGEKRKQDRKFFSEMRDLLDEKGGCEVLLHYLKNFDLSGIDVNDAPKTDALLDQKLISGDSFQQWWHECLAEGKIIGDEWQNQIDKTELRDVFKHYMKDRNITSKWIPTDSGIGKKLCGMCPSVITNQKRRHETRLINVYRLPELEIARKEFEKFIGQEVKWI